MEVVAQKVADVEEPNLPAAVVADTHVDKIVDAVMVDQVVELTNYRYSCPSPNCPYSYSCSRWFPYLRSCSQHRHTPQFYFVYFCPTYPHYRFPFRHIVGYPTKIRKPDRKKKHQKDYWRDIVDAGM